MQVKKEKNIVNFIKFVYNSNVYGGVIGFDSNLEVQIASSGWLLWPL